MKRVTLIITLILCAFVQGEDDPFASDEIQSVEVQVDDMFKIFPDPAGKEYFPKGKSSYYTRYLVAMKEPSVMQSLPESAKKVFRFTYLRSFHDPIVIRLTLFNEVFEVAVTQLEVDREHNPVNTALQKTIKLNRDKSKELLTHLEKQQIWVPVTDIEQALMDRGRDGSTWIFERNDGSGYRMVDIWTPKALSEANKDGALGIKRDFMVYHRLGVKLLKIGKALPSEETFY